MNFSLTTEEGEGENMSMDHTDHMDHMDHMDDMGMSEHHHGDHFRGMDAPGDDSGTSFLKITLKSILLLSELSTSWLNTIS